MNIPYILKPKLIEMTCKCGKPLESFCDDEDKEDFIREEMKKLIKECTHK